MCGEDFTVKGGQYELFPKQSAILSVPRVAVPNEYKPETISYSSGPRFAAHSSIPAAALCSTGEAASTFPDIHPSLCPNCRGVAFSAGCRTAFRSLYQSAGRLPLGPFFVLPSLLVVGVTQFSRLPSSCLAISSHIVSPPSRIEKASDGATRTCFHRT